MVGYQLFFHRYWVYEISNDHSPKCHCIIKANSKVSRLLLIPDVPLSSSSDSDSTASETANDMILVICN